MKKEYSKFENSEIPKQQKKKTRVEQGKGRFDAKLFFKSYRTEVNQIRHHSLLNTIHRTSGKMLPYKQMAVSIRFLTGSGSNKATPKTASDEEDPGASALQALLEFQRKIEDEKKQKVQWYKKYYSNKNAFQ